MPRARPALAGVPLGQINVVHPFQDVLTTSVKYKADMRTAAYIVAINRVATVTRMRGMYA